MRKFLVPILCMLIVCSCSVSRNKKVACPVAASSIGAEKLSDPAIMKKSEKARFKVKGKF